MIIKKYNPISFCYISQVAVVVDNGDYYPDRDGDLVEISAGLPESRWVERHLGRPVLKAFNSINSVSLSDKPRAKGSPTKWRRSTATH
jgi:predicted dinucleotide-binding enzyme